MHHCIVHFGSCAKRKHVRINKVRTITPELNYEHAITITQISTIIYARNYVACTRPVRSPAVLTAILSEKHAISPGLHCNTAIWELKKI